MPGDDAERLAERVLKREHPLLIATLRELAAGRVRLGPQGVQYDGAKLEAPLQLTADNRLLPP
jgi:phosphoribosylglycinamide formyltransferase-1